MQLTQEQETLVSRYVRAVGQALGARLSEAQKERAITRLQESIQSHLRTNGARLARDEEVKAVLDTLGVPEQRAAILARIWGRPDEGASTLSSTDFDAPEPAEPIPREDAKASVAAGVAAVTAERPARPVSVKEVSSPSRPAVSPVWLGVLGHVAGRWHIPAWALRTLVFILGCLAVPAALLAYIMVYLVLHMSGAFRAGRLRPFVMIWRPASVATVSAAIYAAGTYGLRGVRFGHETYLKRSMPDLQEWAWLETEALLMLTATLVLFLPVALLSAMPLSAVWDRTLKRFSQAGVALYAVAVSFGIASFITGLILAFVKEFTS